MGVSAGVGAVVTGATFGLMQIPGVTQFLNTITGDIKSPLLRNLLNHQIAGTVIGTAMGAAGAYNADEDISDGAWKGAKLGFLTGTFSGLGSAANESVSNKSNIFTGKTALASQIEKAAKANNLYSGQKGGAANTEIINEYYKQMVNGTFDAKGGASGYIYDGKTIITDGNHRVAAALLYQSTHNNGTYLQQMLNGRFEYMNPSNYGYKTYKFNVK